MLQQICEEVHNFFISEPYVGSWSISGGMISLPFLMDGQRFWITSSVFNDGVYTYHSNGIKNDDDNAAAGLSDEEVIAAFQKYPATNRYSFGEAWFGGKSKQEIANTLEKEEF